IFMSGVSKKRVIAFILSDFMDDNYDQALKIAANKHDITGIRIYDQKEAEMPNIGFVQMEDAETGELLLVNTKSKQVRNQYAALTWLESIIFKIPLVKVALELSVVALMRVMLKSC